MVSTRQKRKATRSASMPFCGNARLLEGWSNNADISTHKFTEESSNGAALRKIWGWISQRFRRIWRNIELLEVRMVTSLVSSKTHGWTPERRARQAAIIRTWKPWKRSTGPRTDRGKAASSGNRARSLQAAMAEIERARRALADAHGYLDRLKGKP